MRKVIILNVLIFICILIGCETKVLDSPVNLEATEYMISWDNVTNATNYIFNINGIEANISTNTCDLSFLTEREIYLIKVKAVSKNGYRDSNWSNYLIYELPIVQLVTPSEIKVEDSYLKWAKVTNAVNYSIMIDEEEFIADNNIFDLSSYTIPNTYEIKIKALGDEYNIDSNWSNIYYYNVSKIKLEEVLNINVENSIVYWDNVSNAISYIISIDNIEISVVTNNYDIGYITNCATYKIQVKAIGNEDYEDSNWSLVYDYDSTVYVLALFDYSIEDNDIIINEYNGHERNLDIPFGVTKINNNAFENCYINSIVLPDSLEYIGDYAFFNCYNLENITIPKNVKFIGEGVFILCSKLESIYVDYQNQYFSSNNGILFNKNLETLIFFPVRYGLIEYIVPSSVTTIYKFAFYNVEKLKTIIIPSSVKVIDKKAFIVNNTLSLYCIPSKGNVSWVDDFDKNVKVLYDYVENSYYTPGLVFISYSDNTYSVLKGTATNVAHISIPTFYNGKEVRAIHSNGFSNLDNLVSVNIPDSVEIIFDGAFNNCVNLKEAKLPRYLTQIGAYAFASCESLNNIITGFYLEHIGYDAFYNCKSLSNITLNEGIGRIYQRAFGYCISLESILLPASLEVINQSIFINCDKLVQILCEENSKYFTSINGVLYTKDLKKMVAYPYGKKEELILILEGVEIIQNGVFYSNSYIQSVVLSSSVKIIEEYAFFQCVNLEIVTTVEGIVEIREKAFAQCDKLTSFYIPSTLLSLHNETFEKCSKLEHLNVSENSTTFSSLNNILYNKDKTIMYLCGSNITNLIILDTVEIIEFGAIMNNSNIVSVVLSSSVRILREFLFYNCINLEAVYIPKSVTNIEQGLFFNCEKLTIYCEAPNKLATWSPIWVPSYVNIIWGYNE